MEGNETIDIMFGRFRTIINNLRSLGKTYDNYNHITKILRSLSRRWRPQVIALRASKGLKKLPMEELLVTLKAPKGSTSKAFKAKESCGNTSDEDCYDEDQLFISRKIQSMWKHKRRLKWKNNFRKHTKEMKDKMQVVCYKCKKPGYFKFKFPNLEKEEEKEKKKLFIKKKKNIDNTQFIPLISDNILQRLIKPHGYLRRS
ncbi:hypothetical protein CR513_09012, partial [Mucuna pruriens]